MEENIKKQLVEKFASLADKVVIPRQRRIFAEVALADFGQVFDFAVKKLNFSILSNITGLDEGTNFGVIYHISNENGVVLNLHITTPKEKPEVKTITEYFPGAEVYERELMDLFGMEVTGLPAGGRYPLPDNWPADQHPLRKDWKPEMLKEKEGK